MELSATTVFSFPLPGGQLARSWAQSHRGVFFNAVTGCNPVNGLFTHDTAFQPCQCFTAMMPVWCRYIRRWLFQGSGQQKKHLARLFSRLVLDKSFYVCFNKQTGKTLASQPAFCEKVWMALQKEIAVSLCSSGGFSVAFPVYPIWAALSIKKWTLCETIKRGVVFQDNASLLFVWKVRHHVVPQLPTKAIL